MPRKNKKSHNTECKEEKASAKYTPLDPPPPLNQDKNSLLKGFSQSSNIPKMDTPFNNMANNFSGPMFSGPFQSTSNANFGPGIFPQPPNQNPFPPFLNPPVNQNMPPTSFQSQACLNSSQAQFQAFSTQNSYPPPTNTVIPPPPFPQFAQNIINSNMEATAKSLSELTSTHSSEVTSNSTVTIDTSVSNIGNALAGVLAYATLPPLPPTSISFEIDTASIPIPPSVPKPVPPVLSTDSLPKFLDIPRPDSPLKHGTTKTEKNNLDVNTCTEEEKSQSLSEENVDASQNSDEIIKSEDDVKLISVFSNDEMDIETETGTDDSDAEIQPRREMKSVFEILKLLGKNKSNNVNEGGKQKLKKPIKNNSADDSINKKKLKGKCKNNQLAKPADVASSSGSLSIPSVSSYSEVVISQSECSSTAVAPLMFSVPPPLSIPPSNNAHITSDIFGSVSPHVMFSTPPPSVVTSTASSVAMHLPTKAPSTESSLNCYPNDALSRKPDINLPDTNSSELLKDIKGEALLEVKKGTTVDGKEVTNVTNIPSPTRKINLPFLTKEAAKKRLKSFSVTSKLVSKSKGKPVINPLILDSKEDDNASNLVPKKKKKKEKMSVIEQIKDEELRIKEVLTITNSMSHFGTGFGLSELNNLIDNPEALKKFEEKGRDFKELLEKSEKNELEMKENSVSELNDSYENEAEKNSVEKNFENMENKSNAGDDFQTNVKRESTVEKVIPPKSPPKNWKDVKDSKMTLSELKKHFRNYRTRSRSRSRSRSYSRGRKDRRRDSKSYKRDRSPRYERSSHREKSESRERTLNWELHLSPFPNYPRQMLPLIPIRIDRFADSKEYRGAMVNYTYSRPSISYSIDCNKYSRHYWSRREMKIRNKRQSEVMKLVRDFWDSANNFQYSEYEMVDNFHNWYGDKFLEEGIVDCKLVLNEDVKTDRKTDESNKSIMKDISEVKVNEKVKKSGLVPEYKDEDELHSLSTANFSTKLKSISDVGNHRDCDSDNDKVKKRKSFKEEEVNVEGKAEEVIESTSLANIENKLSPTVEDEIIMAKESKTLDTIENKADISIKSKAVTAFKSQTSSAVSSKVVTSVKSKSPAAIESKAVNALIKKGAASVESKTMTEIESDVVAAAVKSNSIANNDDKALTDCTSNNLRQLELNQEYEAFIDNLEYRPEDDISSDDTLKSTQCGRNDPIPLISKESKQIFNLPEVKCGSLEFADDHNKDSLMGTNDIILGKYLLSTSSSIDQNGVDFSLDYTKYGLPCTLPSNKREVKKLMRDSKLTKKGRKILKKLKKKLKTEKKERKRLKMEMKKRKKLEKKIKKRARLSKNIKGSVGFEDAKEVENNRIYSDTADLNYASNISTLSSSAPEFQSNESGEIKIHYYSSDGDNICQSSDITMKENDTSSSSVPDCSKNLFEVPINNKDNDCLPKIDTTSISSDKEFSTSTSTVPTSIAATNQTSREKGQPYQSIISSPYSPSSPQISDDENIEVTSSLIKLDSIPMPPTLKDENFDFITKNTSLKTTKADKESSIKLPILSSLVPDVPTQKPQPIAFKLGVKHSLPIKKPVLPGFEFNDEEIDVTNKNSDSKLSEKITFSYHSKIEDSDILESKEAVVTDKTKEEIDISLGKDECKSVGGHEEVSSRGLESSDFDEVQHKSLISSNQKHISTVSSSSVKCDEDINKTAQGSHHGMKYEEEDNQKRKIKAEKLSESRCSNRSSKRDSSSPHRSKRDAYSPPSKRGRRRDSPIDSTRRSRRVSRSPSKRQYSPSYSSRRRSRSPGGYRGSSSRHSPRRSKSSYKDRRSNSPSPPPGKKYRRGMSSSSPKRESLSSGDSSHVYTSGNEHKSDQLRSPGKYCSEQDIKIDHSKDAIIHKVQEKSEEKENSSEFFARPIDSISNHFGNRELSAAQNWEWQEIPPYSQGETSIDDKPSSATTGISPKRLSLDERLRQEHGLDIDEPSQSDVPTQDYQWGYEATQDEANAFSTGSDKAQVIRIGNVLQVLPQDNVSSSTSAESTESTSAKALSSPFQVGGASDLKTEDRISFASKEVEIGGIKINLSMPPPSLAATVATGTQLPIPVPPVASVPLPPPPLSGGPGASLLASNPMSYISSLISSSKSDSLSSIPTSIVTSTSNTTTSPSTRSPVISTKDNDGIANDKEVTHLKSMDSNSVVANNMTGQDSPIAKLLSVLQIHNIIGGQSTTAFNNNEELSTCSVTGDMAASAAVVLPALPSAINLEEFRKLRKERKERKRQEREARQEKRKQKALMKKEEAERKEIELAFIEQTQADAQPLPKISGNEVASIDDEDDEILKEAMTEVPEMGSPIPDYLEMNSDEEDDYGDSKKEKPTPVPLPSPPEKGILMCPTLSSSEGRRKSVNFADGVAPGYGTSPSGGEEEIHSSPPPTLSTSLGVSKKKKMRRRKKKAKARPIKQFTANGNILDSPPPPPSSPPTTDGVIELYPGCTHYTCIAPSTFVVYTRQTARELASNPLPPSGQSVNIPAGMLLHPSVLSGGYAPQSAGFPPFNNPSLIVSNIPPSLPIKLPAVEDNSLVKGI